MIKVPVPEKHLITPPECKIEGCTNPCLITTAYDKGQKYKKVCSKHHRERLKELEKQREEKEKEKAESATLENFFSLKKFYTRRKEEADNSLLRL